AGNGADGARAGRDTDARADRAGEGDPGHPRGEAGATVGRRERQKEECGCSALSFETPPPNPNPPLGSSGRAGRDPFQNARLRCLERVVEGAVGEAGDVLRVDPALDGGADPVPAVAGDGGRRWWRARLRENELLAG